MSIVLVTGGSGSGKSEFAEKLALEMYESNCRDNEAKGEPFGSLLYVATMKSTDAECDRKIEIHKKRRENTAFSTIEKPREIGRIPVDSGDVVLLECISNLLANEMYSGNYEDSKGIRAVDRILKDIEILADVTELVIVSNEVSFDISLEKGLGAGGYSKETLQYIKNINIINRHLATMAKSVYEVVAGIPIEVKND